ncbi:MAG TPA: xanthine dehydrogenase family protein molybdopterin-binding subunit, partial [Stellaceae bacterium]|nr:xanthine dehydrogenase family protein molybdopterin-binding subunit [Stellaceae bacterium]
MSARDSEDHSLVGKPVRRFEDRALLMGRGRFADDLPVAPRTLHAHIVRSPHAHAKIVRIDAAAALATAGVHAVITGADIAKLTDPFLVAVKAPIPQWSLAVERVRFVGEPVAVVLASDRYRAEDAGEKLDVEYERLPAVVDPGSAIAPGAPLVHADAGSNVVSERHFVYGNPARAFAEASARVAVSVRYPRNSFTPIECFVVAAEYDPASDSYDTTANFQGPFSIHPVMARALRVPGTRLRLRTPKDSGGSFGAKLAVFPYIVLMCACSRIAGRPVKWVEDRLEHLQAASCGPVRIATAEAAVTREGRILALKFDNIEDYGAYLRAPMPGPLYRMHGAASGAYDVANVEILNRVVLTNTMPAGLIRGFGGPQHYLALERLMHQIAVELRLDPLDVIRKNLVRSFPYDCAAGSRYDSGDFARAIDVAVDEGRLAALEERRAAARHAGRIYGIGFAAVVEPALSNMGYLSTLLTAEARERAGPKNGALALATVAIDPLGAVSVTADVPNQGQSHATALAQVVGDALGLEAEDVRVDLEIDTAKDAWSIAAGTYSSRFAGGTAVAAHMAATQLRARLAAIAAKQLNVRPTEVEFARGKLFGRGNPDNALAFARVAGTAHWSPALLPDGVPPSLRETGAWMPPGLDAPAPDDRINPALTYGFVFDFCGVEIDPATASVRVDSYVSMHDAGTILNPLVAEGQIRGSFVQGLAS